MAAPLLATKLSIPSTGKYLVERPYLATKLDECLHPGCRLVLISAPAGYGKTTLLTAWLAKLNSSEQRPAPLIAWVSLDDRDNEPVLFWSYIITAIQTQHEAVGKQSLNQLRGAIPPDLEGSLALLINELNEISNPFVLIVDDYHFIRNPAIHQSLAFLFEHLPGQFHVILASRTDPPLPLALLRGRGQLLEIRQNDLRFSTKDAGSFLNSGMSLNLSSRAVEALNQKTEGWIAGLQMAALSLREAATSGDYERIENFISAFSGSNRYILDYLIEEVLNQQPEEIQNFLLKTSILDRFCNSLCEALLADMEGDSSRDPQKVLEYLDSNNLFLIPLDKERYWYRYHRLFADLLRKSLAQRFDPAVVTRLHKSASEWHQKNGSISESVDHALAANDFEQAAGLAEEFAMTMFVAGEWVTLLGWVKRLPESFIRSRAWLCIYYAWGLIFTGQLEPVESLLRTAEELIQNGSGKIDHQDILGNIAVIRARVAARKDDLQQALGLAQRASAILPQENLMARSAAEFVKGEAYFEEGSLAQAMEGFLQAKSLGETAANLYVIVPAITETVKILKIQGKLWEAADLYQKAIELLEGQEERHPRLYGPVFVGYGDLLREWNDLPSAHKFTTRGIEVSEKYGNTNTTALGYATLAWIRHAQGDPLGAEKASRKSIQLIRDVYSRTAKMVIASRVGLSLAHGKIQQALACLEENRIDSATSLCFANEFGCTALARVLLAQEKQEEALRLLDDLLTGLQAGGYLGWLIQVQNLRAMALYSLNKPANAIRALETSLAQAEPEGYIRSFVDEGEPMEKLLAVAVQKGIHTEYASQLLASFPNSPQPLVREMKVRNQNLDLVESLSAREIDVLQLIAEGLTNKEIALRLCVSVRTVKFHTTSIYSKLEVNGRAHAAIKAKELGILK